MTATIRLAADTPLMLGIRITIASLALAAAISAAGLAPPAAVQPTGTDSIAAPEPVTELATESATEFVAARP